MLITLDCIFCLLLYYWLVFTVCNTAERNEIISILNRIDLLLQMDACAVFLCLRGESEIVFWLCHVSIMLVWRHWPTLWLCCHLLGNAQLLANTFSIIIKTVLDVKDVLFHSVQKMSSAYRLLTVLKSQIKITETHTYKNVFDQNRLS